MLFYEVWFIFPKVISLGDLHIPMTKMEIITTLVAPRPGVAQYYEFFVLKDVYTNRTLLQRFSGIESRFHCIEVFLVKTLSNEHKLNK